MTKREQNKAFKRWIEIHDTLRPLRLQQKNLNDQIVQLQKELYVLNQSLRASISGAHIIRIEGRTFLRDSQGMREATIRDLDKEDNETAEDSN